MAVLQMQRISICALKKNRKAILEKLQAMGVMEINHIPVSYTHLTLPTIA